MKVLVGVKRVVDYRVPVQAHPNGKSVQTKGLAQCLNPFDALALTAALQWHKAGYVDQVIAISCGPDETALRYALAMGAHQAIHAVCDTLPTSLAVAHCLKEQVIAHEIDLVCLGKQSIDTDNHQVGPMLAGLLNWPQVTCATEVMWQNAELHVSQDTPEGSRTLACPWPCVLTVDLGIAELSYPNFMQINAAGASVITSISMPDPTLPSLKTLACKKVKEQSRKQHLCQSMNELLTLLQEEGV